MKHKKRRRSKSEAMDLRDMFSKEIDTERARTKLELAPSQSIEVRAACLNAYCHEGLAVIEHDRKKFDEPYEARICSDNAFAKTRERAIAKLAAKVLNKLTNGVFGC